MLWLKGDIFISRIIIWLMLQAENQKFIQIKKHLLANFGKIKCLFLRV